MIITDVCIIGAGPGGAAAALQLDRLGIPCVVVDKAVFPRDKVCGDGLSGKVIAGLNRIDPAIGQRLQAFAEKENSWGVTFVAPGRTGMDVPYKPNYNPAADAPIGFVCKRIHFDNFLVDELKQCQHVQLIEGKSIDNYTQTAGGYELSDAKGTLRISAQMIIVANGAHSAFTKDVAGIRMEPKHYAAGVRAYYTGVTGMHDHSYIELHFLKNLLPGYLWIFPLPNGEANVGIDMPSDTMRRRKVNLKTLLHETLASDPVFSERFRSARPVSPVEGYGLPLGSRSRRLSGERWMLVGDAAFLIDPFTGEGIGNAIYSGGIAAKQAAECLQSGDFSAEKLLAYDASIQRVLGAELRLSTKLQKLVRYPRLFNLLMKAGTRNKQLRDVISSMFYEVDLRKKLTKPSFYIKLILNR
ncbi:NAD(P)/FAD-dependent oxidoreductase [Chitinophaga sp.]|uniref:NAD(P)/FAD-dependent oxidoreductase n=1 Tax=Chitinophaga sp. TaxID=1869181 RepID=UPI002636DF10|nr:geranylgeranyl reductase family protein [uncultured Chitinophaga sp.]